MNKEAKKLIRVLGLGERGGLRSAKVGAIPPPTKPYIIPQNPPISSTRWLDPLIRHIDNNIRPAAGKAMRKRLAKRLRDVYVEELDRLKALSVEIPSLMNEHKSALKALAENYKIRGKDAAKFLPDDISAAEIKSKLSEARKLLKAKGEYVTGLREIAKLPDPGRVKALLPDPGRVKALLPDPDRVKALLSSGKVKLGAVLASIGIGGAGLYLTAKRGGGDTEGAAAQSVESGEPSKPADSENPAAMYSTVGGIGGALAAAAAAYGMSKEENKLRNAAIAGLLGAAGGAGAGYGLSKLSN